MDVEGRWTDLLAANKITGIIRGLRKITDNDGADVEEILTTFSSWLQRTSEFTKKELLSLCFSRCQGLWMFLNHYSFRRVHNLLQKLRTLLTLVHWARKKLYSGHLLQDSSFWNQEHKELKKHLWLGRLVEWWSLMGLLPKHPESQGEKQICHMWKEMSQNHQKAGMKESEMERGSSIIQGLVTHLVKQHGLLWTIETSGHQCYPPPSLKALLKLVLVPHVDSLSVQAIIMYFILDMAKFLQCRNNLFKSYCHAFTIHPSFSHQIRAFWMLDHGQIKASIELLLSPKAALPRFSWQHHCILNCLLLKKEHQLALRYYYWTRPSMESTGDVKLCIGVLLQNRYVSEAWALLKRNHTESDDMVTHFLQACDASGQSAEASKYVPAGCEVHSHNKDEPLVISVTKGSLPCPLSARLYQAQRDSAVSSEELLQLITKAVTELRQAPASTLREFTWPHHRETKPENTQVFLSVEVLHHRTPSPSLLDIPPRNEDYNQQPKNPEHYSSCPSPAVYNRRRVSFSSVSSLSPIKEQAFSFESTVTLQQISALLTDDQDEEEVSHVSLAAEVFSDSHDQSQEGATVFHIDNTFSSHSFRNRVHSSDCTQELPSLPEEVVHTPTKESVSTQCEDISSEGAASDCLPQDELYLGEIGLQVEQTCALSETSLNLLSDENQSSPLDKPLDGDSKTVAVTASDAPSKPLRQCHKWSTHCLAYCIDQSECSCPVKAWPNNADSQLKPALLIHPLSQYGLHKSSPRRSQRWKTGEQRLHSRSAYFRKGLCEKQAGAEKQKSNEVRQCAHNA